MTWNAFHNRGETLRTVINTADFRLDGILPWEVPGAREHFHDDLDLLSALMIKWHARVSGNIERALAQQPLDLEMAVATAWRHAEIEMPGVRKIIDHYSAVPATEFMGECMRRAAAKEWTRMALAAGAAQDEGPQAIRAGERIEVLARTMVEVPPLVPEEEEPERERTLSLVSRLRNFVAA